MRAKEISQLDTIPLTNDTAFLVYNQNNGTGKTTLRNIWNEFGVKATTNERKTEDSTQRKYQTVTFTDLLGNKDIKVYDGRGIQDISPIANINTESSAGNVYRIKYEGYNASDSSTYKDIIIYNGAKGFSIEKVYGLEDLRTKNYSQAQKIEEANNPSLKRKHIKEWIAELTETTVNAWLNSQVNTDGVNVGAYIALAGYSTPTDDSSYEDYASWSGRLYIKQLQGTTYIYTFIADLSGAQGIQGPQGYSISGIDISGDNDSRTVTIHRNDPNGEVPLEDTSFTLSNPNFAENQSGKVSLSEFSDDNASVSVTAKNSPYTAKEFNFNFTLPPAKSISSITQNVEEGRKKSAITINYNTSGNDSETLYVYDGEKGEKGEKGDTPTIEVGTVETIAPGSQAEVNPVETETGIKLNFKIPQGINGVISESENMYGFEIDEDGDLCYITTDDIDDGSQFEIDENGDLNYVIEY